MISATSITVMHNMIWNRRSLPFGGINPANLKMTGMGAIVKARMPMTMAPRFLPRVFDMNGPKTNAMIADTNTISVSKDVWRVVNSQKNPLMK